MSRGYPIGPGRPTPALPGGPACPAGGRWEWRGRGGRSTRPAPPAPPLGACLRRRRGL